MIFSALFDRASLRAVSEAQGHGCVTVHGAHLPGSPYLELTPVAKLDRFVTPVSATVQAASARRLYVQGERAKGL
jgi:hypothetical protein